MRGRPPVSRWQALSSTGRARVRAAPARPRATCLEAEFGAARRDGADDPAARAPAGGEEPRARTGMPTLCKKFGAVQGCDRSSAAHGRVEHNFASGKFGMHGTGINAKCARTD